MKTTTTLNHGHIPRLAFWAAIALVAVVFGRACAEASRPPKVRHFEMAPDPAVHPTPAPAGPEPPEAPLVASR